MKKIKNIILLLFIILLTGCQKEYNLIVTDDEIIEEFRAIVPNDEDNKEKIMASYFPLHANNNEIYNKKIIEKDNMLNIYVNYTYRPRDFVNSNSVNECFTNRKIIVDNDKYYYFKLNKVRECATEYDLDINIITDNKVLMNNADKVNGNKYTWYLKENNKEEFDLEIKIAKGVKRKNIFLIVIVVASIILLCSIFVIFLLSKNRKSNAI